MLTILITALTPTADALSCMYGPGDAFPLDGAVEVTLDAIPRVSLYGLMSLEEQEVVLIDEATGELVPVTIEVTENPGDTHMAWLRPDSPLQPETAYSVATLSSDDLEDAWRMSTFTTGSAALAGEPAPPAVLGADRDRGRDMWGSWDWIQIEVDSEPATYRIQVASSADFSDAREVDVLASTYGEGTELSVGSGVCGGPLPLERGEKLVRVAAVDYAGNVSAFSEHSSAGCSAISGASSLTGALLGLLAVIGMRRRSVTA